MRQLATTELATVSGGNGDAIILGLGLGLGLGLIASTPSYGYYPSYSYPSYSYTPSYYYPPVCDQFVTPVFDPYTGAYMGDMIDTYCY